MPLTLTQVQRNSRSLYLHILRESRQLEASSAAASRDPCRWITGLCLVLLLLQGFPRHANDTNPAAIQDHIRRVEQDIHCVLRDHGQHSS